MMNIDEALSTLGLSPNETAIYLYLLRNGERDGASVYRECRLDKSSAYRALRELEAKGLTYSLGEKRNQQFAAYPLNKLEELVVKKVENIKQVEKVVRSFDKELGKYVKESFLKQRISLYSGAKGYVLWNEQRLIDAKGEIRECLVQEDLLKGYGGEDQYYQEIQGFIERRVELKIKMKVLANGGDSLDHLDRTRPEILKEVRMLPTKIDKPAGYSTWGDYLGLETWSRGEFLGIIIHDELLTRMLNGMFDYMWSTAKEVKP